jgi:hypothetical protein
MRKERKKLKARNSRPLSKITSTKLRSLEEWMSIQCRFKIYVKNLGQTCRQV